LVSDAATLGPLTNASPNHSGRGRRAVEMICVHWTGGSYESALDWICRDESDVSYHELIGPAGQLALSVAPERAAWSVGTSRAPAPFTCGGACNSASYNIALAGGPPTPPTEAARAVLVERIARAFQYFAFPPADVWRIVGHSALAVYPKGHPKAGQYGRKVDCEGSAWLPLPPVRVAVAAALANGGNTHRA
jgi:N-acetylmuramoyl-L-alanine amidase